MDPITVILTALVAGATTGALDGLKDDVKDKAKAAYGKLRDLVNRRFREAQTPRADAILAEFDDDPEGYKDPLARKLDAAGADKDDALLAAAQAFLDLVQQPGPKSGKYNVTITGSEGVQVGDHNSQTNTFGAKS
jgi:hypothetical protein